HIRLYAAATGRVEWSHHDKTLSWLAFLDANRLVALEVHRRPVRMWDCRSHDGHDLSPAEAAELAPILQTAPTGEPVHLWLARTRVAPRTPGTEVGCGPATAPPVEFEARGVGENWELVRGGVTLFLGTGLAALAATPDGRVWAVRTEDGWQLYTLAGG